MRGLLVIAAMIVAAGGGAMVSAQSAGSVESELGYAREYMEAGNWQYAMWRYEAVLAREPDNAEAKAGYERAKAAHEARARPAAPERGPTAEEMATPRETSPTRPAFRGPAPARKTSPAQAECDRLFGSCWVSSKSPTCFTQKTLCYRRNGIDE